ncbi:MAG TPA: hypothetical protein VF091_00260 [Gaiellaceae bacterium]
MGEGLTSGRLDLIGRYMHDEANRPSKAPPWTNEAPRDSPADTSGSVQVERDAEVTAHAIASIAPSDDSLHRFHDTYDRIAGAAMLAELWEKRQASSDVEAS